MQTGWHMVTLFKCFSMCLRCQHLFHTPLHLKEGKKDVSVTFCRCQVWKEKEGIKRERGRVIWEICRCISYITFLFVLKRLTEGALYQEHTGSFTSTYTISHTGASQYISTFLADSLKFLLSRKNRGVKRLQRMLSFTTVHYSRCIANFVIAWALWTFDCRHPVDRVLCHFALIVSL